ncbi:hypothetical protein IPZ58_07630 [Streptomyces roseoverticillatus]|uniref:hypothetical protein n=1 Tax=Streptomyces roseoverticillatus TaxID=66429 RepID=UPI001F3150B5|nr:hypothetical protein [Streptomyces roseoverticillatus]MCF3101450.1 hypothetical protein [Streptomyces roseoverticillatus]
MRLNWPNLTWNKARWPGRTYRAKSADGTYTYKITHDHHTWHLSIWRNGRCIRIPNRAGQAVEHLQQIADDHAAAHATP